MAGIEIHKRIGAWEVLLRTDLDRKEDDDVEPFLARLLSAADRACPVFRAGGTRRLYRTGHIAPGR